MGVRDYFRGEPVVRNERMVRSLAMASHDRMNEVRAPMVVAEGVIRAPTFSRGNLTHAATGLRRLTQAPANDKVPVKERSHSVER